MPIPPGNRETVFPPDDRYTSVIEGVILPVPGMYLSGRSSCNNMLPLFSHRIVVSRDSRMGEKDRSILLYLAVENRIT